MTAIGLVGELSSNSLEGMALRRRALTFIIGGLVTDNKIPIVTVNYTVRKEPESARTRTSKKKNQNKNQFSR